MSPAGAEVAREALAALGREDPDGFVALLHPEVEIETAKGARHGVGAAREWASKRYDHLIRRWEIDEVLEEGDRLLLVGRVQYVWRDGGEVGADTQTAIGFEVEAGAIRRLRLFETVAEGLEDLDRATVEDSG